MLQLDTPDTYVISTDETHSVRSSASWRSTGSARLGAARRRRRGVFFRPAEVDLLVGDSTKARSALGAGSPTSASEQLCMMVDADSDCSPAASGPALDVGPIVVLAGGVGAARFLAGLVRVVDPPR
ncbi:MAG: hypothetical protein R2690_13695 [Acidimicrobiales bacterium]